MYSVLSEETVVNLVVYYCSCCVNCTGGVGPGEEAPVHLVRLLREERHLPAFPGMDMDRLID